METTNQIQELWDWLEDELERAKENLERREQGESTKWRGAIWGFETVMAKIEQDFGDQLNV